MFALPARWEASVVLPEFTWMLLVGPPQIVIFGVPCNWKASFSVGWSTIIGIGANRSTIAAVAVAVTLVNDVGVIIRMRVVSTLRDTVARTRVVAYEAERFTPGAEPGKS